MDKEGSTQLQQELHLVELLQKMEQVAQGENVVLVAAVVDLPTPERNFPSVPRSSIPSKAPPVHGFETRMVLSRWRVHLDAQIHCR